MIMYPNTKISKTTGDAAVIVASIDDLLTQIFQRLPIRPLVRFKSVCKHWLSLIGATDPRLRPQRNQAAAGLIFQFPNEARRHASTLSYAYMVPLDKSSSTSPPFRTMEFPKELPPPWDIKILSSCNGLLVFGYSEFHYGLWNYYICNPTTNKYSKLDEGTWMSKTIGLDCWMCLAFDPSNSPNYKIVCVRGLGRTRQYQFEVYSSETGSWGNHGGPFAAQYVDFGNGVYWNGAIHWISFSVTGRSIYFNPEEDHQMPQVMPVPPILDRGYWRGNYYFGESCGHLHYIDDCNKATEFNVYEMRRDYSEWFVKHRVDLSYVVSCLIRPSFFRLYNLVRGEKDEDSYLVLRIWRRIVRYNLVYRTCETVHEFHDDVGYNVVSACGTSCDTVPRLKSPDAGFPLQYIESICSA